MEVLSTSGWLSKHTQKYTRIDTSKVRQTEWCHNTRHKNIAVFYLIRVADFFQLKPNRAPLLVHFYYIKPLCLEILVPITN